MAPPSSEDGRLEVKPTYDLNYPAARIVRVGIVTVGGGVSSGDAHVDPVDTESDTNPAR